MLFVRLKNIIIDVYQIKYVANIKGKARVYLKDDTALETTESFEVVVTTLATASAEAMKQ